MVDHDDVVFVYAPIRTPQPALDVVLVLVDFEIFMLLLIFELYQHAFSGLKTVKFILPDLQLLRHRVESLITTESK